MAERGAIVINWGEGRPEVGPKGLEVFANALGYYDGLLKQGRITGYRVYASTTHAEGTLVIEGDLAELAKIQIEPESQKQLMLGSAVVRDLTADLCVGGSADDVAQFYATGVQALEEAGLNR